MAGQCHRSYQHDFDQTPGGSGRQEGLACSGPWSHEELDTTTKQQQFSLLQPAPIESCRGALILKERLVLTQNKVD